MTVKHLIFGRFFYLVLLAVKKESHQKYESAKYSFKSNKWMHVLNMLVSKLLKAHF